MGLDLAVRKQRVSRVLVTDVRIADQEATTDIQDLACEQLFQKSDVKNALSKQYSYACFIYAILGQRKSDLRARDVRKRVQGLERSFSCCGDLHFRPRLPTSPLCLLSPMHH